MSALEPHNYPAKRALLAPLTEGETEMGTGEVTHSRPQAELRVLTVVFRISLTQFKIPT